jgi:hypothetical protein
LRRGLPAGQRPNDASFRQENCIRYLWHDEPGSRTLECVLPLDFTQPPRCKLNEAESIADYHWLVSPAAKHILEVAAADARPLLAQLQSLRKELSAERAHLVLEQIELRGRAKAKFKNAERLFFDRLGLEQSTDDVTASYKAERFPPNQPIADLCCGIGGDLMAIGKRGDVQGVERNERLVILAEANGRAVRELAPENDGETQLLAGDIRECNLAGFAAWHIDPDRRPEGRRTTRVELHEPSSTVWAELLQRNPNAAIKLAPAAELTPDWERQNELEWISRDGSCRQMVVWCGNLAKSPGMRRATVLSGTNDLRASIEGKPVFVSQSATIGRYLFEPDAAVLAAELVGAQATKHNLAAVIPGGGYLTGDLPIVDDPTLAAFEVQEVLPFQLKRIKSLLRERGLGRLEVKKRGVDHDPEKLRRELKVPGENAATLFVTRLESGITAILAKRLTTR